MIVVSDGSIDDTAERLLLARSDTGIRVIHYDRNLGKGYAVKAGSLAAQGEWVAMIDADLDVDPGSIPAYVEIARREQLDFAIGSKRHPDSDVQYPALRRVASWCYQQLNRTLFHLDVKDTQVGLKVFSRAVVDDVMPLLLVKRFAFDLELLAVGAALGHRRVRELPVRLEYRFTGSELHSRAVARALWDTFAIFYRLRVLHTYQRKQRLLRGASALPPRSQPPGLQPLVSFIGAREIASMLDYPRLEVVDSTDRREGSQKARGELLAMLAPSGRPAGNWVTAAVPYFADERVAAVVCPVMAPLATPLRERAAAAVLESRLGTGFRRMRYLPGNVRVVPDHPAESVVIRRASLSRGARCRRRRRSDGCLARRARAPDGLHTRHLDIVDAPAPCPPAPSWSRATRAVARSRGPPDAGCKRERRDGALPGTGRRCRRRRLASACGRPHQEDRGRARSRLRRSAGFQRSARGPSLPISRCRTGRAAGRRRDSGRVRVGLRARLQGGCRRAETRAVRRWRLRRRLGFAPPWPASR